MQPLKAYLLCHNAQANALYNSWYSGIAHEIVEEYDQSWEPPDDCGVVISHLHYDFPTASILSRITAENRVPVLILADGILEFRNTYSNPGVPSGSVFMPVHGHKIACLGPSQARRIASWGNQGKAEVVGLPRLDSIRGIRPEPEASGTFKVLVVTARQPGFTERQLEMVQESLVDVRNFFAKSKTIQGKSIEPIWRLTGGLNEKIGVEQESPEVERSISDVLKSVDAVISTPSTILIESMLLDLPTATLDYTNSPKFVATAWTISAIQHIAETVADLVDPQESRRQFQRGSLADAYQLEEPATERMVRLVQGLVNCRKLAIENNSALEIPDSIIGGGGSTLANGQESSVETVSLGDLFPCQVGFRANDLEALTTQYEQLCQAVHGLHSRVDLLRTENALARQQVRIARRHHDYVADQVKWLRTEIQRLNLALRISRRPTRLHRRLRVRTSIAFLRWQYFVEVVEDTLPRESMTFQLDQLFELTAYPKGNKIPATIHNYQANPRGKPRIKMWKYRPTNALLKKMSRAVSVQNRKLQARRVMKAS